jgi:hypothetical protein
MNQPQQYLTFTTAQDAREYRHEHGTGGWIFAPDSSASPVVLFPPDMYPTAILHHPFTRGLSGELIGAQ